MATLTSGKYISIPEVYSNDTMEFDAEFGWWEMMKEVSLFHIY
jgi:hypothetical protein